MDFSLATDKEILNELSSRVKQWRLNINMTQKDLASYCGVHVQTIKTLEGSGRVTLETVIKVLRAFNQLGSLDKILPSPGISPIQLHKLQGKQRKAASKSKK